MRKVVSVLVFLGLGLSLGLLSWSVWLQMEVPEPTGNFAVGRTWLRWVDESRPEVLSEDPNDRRVVAAEIWYPAVEGSSPAAPYFPSLKQVREALAASGEVHPLEAAGLGLVRSHSLLDSKAGEGPFAVVLLSPGNGTNVEFYSALAEDLASHGFVVVGLNPPYDVAAVALNENNTAGYDREQWELTPAEHQAYTGTRIDVRVQDARYALTQLEILNAETGGLLAGKLDLDRVGMMGHSLGGIAAAQTCALDTRLKACVNLDGIQAGGALSAKVDGALPEQPFLFITKETALADQLVQQIEGLPGGGTVVVIEGARHDSFTDGPLLAPGLLPSENQADRLMEQIRVICRAFFIENLSRNRV